MVSTPGRDCKGTVEPLYNNSQGKASMSKALCTNLVPNGELVTIMVDTISYVYEDRHNEDNTFIVLTNGLVLCVRSDYVTISMMIRGLLK